eukprot:NODE_2179_length_1490_cov_140.550841_g2071_i0.p2 GENE.NODE_2179_length_1490_cov_140.550841_g2071_i0~~NODE_2179_length_1490_cov_140.550841_g2071_i0.p2  ORF type:complete len:134 (+),score=15.20 NODE_2179_length_1490_cov_140.550841_g2071_i0:835-1236(+)
MPCSLTEYELQLSTGNWPSKQERHTYVDSMIEREDPEIHELGPGDPDYDYLFAQMNDQFISNQGSAQIYYQLKQLESVTEEKAYDVGAFLSDIGGMSGLFTGFSIMSWFELFEYFFEILRTCCGKARPLQRLP